MQEYHVSVLKSEVLEYLAVQPDKQYIDATLGGGGHTGGILERGGRVLGIDVDEDALKYVGGKFEIRNPKSENLILARGNFREIDSLAKENGFEHVAGVLFDLGVSSHQFDAPERGFSFRESGPLDMRMDQTLTVGAKDLINGLTERELADLFYRLGEEYQSRIVAKEIVRERAKHPIETTGELEKIVRHALGGRTRSSKAVGIHPATKVFQALRIVVNDELHSLEEALPRALALLEPNGRLVVISFHSMEDRIVKNAFRDFAERGLGTILTAKPVTPTPEEVERNPRARSSKLRAFAKSL